MATRDERRVGERLIGLFALGCVLFSPPLIAVAAGGTLFGIPSAYVYLFLAWAVVIAGLAWMLERHRHRRRQPDGEEDGRPP